MNQNWRKLGRIFVPNSEKNWMHSHASVPIAEHIRDSLYRIYFSSRDKKNRSFTGYIVIDIENPQKILELSNNPVLVPGNLGEFDDSGAMGSWLTNVGGYRFMYYIGWNLGVTVPFRNSIGLAISHGNDVYTRYSKGPILDRTKDEPHFTASCCVLRSHQRWNIWYVSCTDWFEKNGKPEHRYHIKYAYSLDGIHWDRKGIVAIDFKDDSEFAISRPCVIKDHDVWRMWYSYRGVKYRIGYAESLDGINWERMDEKCNIVPSPCGWDSEMIEYPFVFDHEGFRYMIYNGNGYGKTGFGLAVMESN